MVDGPGELGPASLPDDVDVVVVGASAGGVTALVDLVEQLPETGAAVLVVLHIPATGRSVLADILRRRASLPVARATAGQPLRRGEIVVAPPDFHLLVAGDQVDLVRSARVNGHRPAIDPLFESASRSFGRRVLGVLLSGTLDDGVAGLGVVRSRGGTTAVQDPAEAPYPGMPTAAIEAGVVDEVRTIAGLAELVKAVAAASQGPFVPRPEPESHLDPARARDTGHPDMKLSALSCPNCGGSLWEVDRGGITQYECRVGHRYSPTSLFQVQGEALDDALWAAHRALLERADLARRMARRMRRMDLTGSAFRYDREADESERRAETLGEALTVTRPPDPTDDDIENIAP